jgi:hypothetical protein
VPTGFDQNDGFALALGGDGRHYARRGGAVYADIDFAGGLCGAGEYQAAEAKTKEKETGMHVWWCFFEFTVVVKIGKFGGLCKGGFLKYVIKKIIYLFLGGLSQKREHT